MRSADSRARPRPNPWVTVVLAVVLTLLAECVRDDEEADQPASTAGDPVETTAPWWTTTSERPPGSGTGDAL